MALRNRPAGKIETLVSIAILLALGAIAATMILRQVHYTSSFLAALAAPSTNSTSSAPAAPQGGDLSAYAGKDLAVMSPMESFTPDDLYKKIDGRADLYQTAGVVGMRCQRLAQTADRQSWLEAFIYDMGDPDNAFTVYSKQRRPGVQEFAERAYQTSNAMYFAHGKYYVEIVAGTGGEALVQAMQEYRQNFISSVAGKATSEINSIMALFPTEDLQPGSISRSGEDDFGIEGFQNAFLAVYRVDGTNVTAFLNRLASAKEAADAAAAYRNSFQSFGGQVEPAGADIPNGSVITVLNTTKIVFAVGPFVAGVHESPQRAAAEKVAARLAKKLSEAAK
ncbi:MAG: DUF6599 family protein [Phycisphaerae bacterium]|jgi:hypothetical protein